MWGTLSTNHAAQLIWLENRHTLDEPAAAIVNHLPGIKPAKPS